jgi:eukaryotic-like serine/threonine-protein kinase
VHERPVNAPAAGGSAARARAGATDSAGSHTHEEMRAFLQARVSAFGLMMAFVFGVFFVWRAVAALVEDDPDHAFLPWQALAVASFAAVWLLCRGRPRSMRFVQITEVAGVVIGGVAAMVMASHIAYIARPDYILLLSLTCTMIGRAVLVPSTPRMTLGLCLVVGIALIVTVYFIHFENHDPSVYSAAASWRLFRDPATVARGWALTAALWWAMASFIATGTSKVIYGLREEVRDARRLGQYTLTEKLGEGGMGVVYLARHAMLRRPTAIKLLPPDRFGPESLARFEREVQLTAGLTHPNTIRIFDYGRTPDRIFYYAMEYLDGASLADVIAAGGPMPPGRVIHILDQTAGALSEAHGVGLIHRDIKPENIFLTQQGGVPDVVKVLDFGLVKQVGAIDGHADTLPALSRADTITGTPLYMAPESITRPDTVDGRADLYALGAVGYFLVTGQHVFAGGSVLEVCGHHLHSQPTPPSVRLGARLPADLEGLILSCLAKDPAERPADARSVRTALRACRDSSAWSEEDACAWFEAHAESLRARQSRGSVGSDTTVAIDLGRRPPDAARPSALGR